MPDANLNLKTEEDVIDKVVHLVLITFLYISFFQVGYKLEEKLDAGGFGVIFFARDKKKNLKVACKQMDLGDWDEVKVRDMKNVRNHCPIYWDQFTAHCSFYGIQELFIMERVKHLYIIKLYAHFLTSSSNGNRL